MCAQSNQTARAAAVACLPYNSPGCACTSTSAFCIMQRVSRTMSRGLVVPCSSFPPHLHPPSTQVHTEHTHSYTMRRHAGSWEAHGAVTIKSARGGCSRGRVCEMRRDALRLDGINGRHPSIGPGVLARGTRSCPGHSLPTQAPSGLHTGGSGCRDLLCPEALAATSPDPVCLA